MDINEMEWPLSKEELEYLYWEEGMLQKEIGKKFNKNSVTVLYWMKKYKIKTRGTSYYKSKNHKKFKKEVYNLVGEEYTILGKYKHSQIKIKMKHNKCGHIYKVTPNNFLKGRGCPRCTGKDLNTEDFAKEVFELVGNEYEVLGEYKDSFTKILMKHNKCGTKYEVLRNNFLIGRRCPHCSSKGLRTHKQFLYLFKKEVGEEYTILGKYKHSQIKIKIKHNKCGHKYKVKPNNFLHNDRRCPRCALMGFSRGEKKIQKFLNSKNIKNKWQHKYDECKNKNSLPFDFKIKGKPIVIEYNGKQHYEPIDYWGGEEKFQKQQKNDNIKKQYCKENNIKLIEIPYWEKDNIEEILEEELMLD